MHAPNSDSPLQPDRLELWFRARAEALGRFYRIEPLPELEAGFEPGLEDAPLAADADFAEPVEDDAESEGWKKLCSLADSEAAAAAADLGIRDGEPLVRFADVVLDSDWAQIEQLFQKEMRRTPFA